VDGADAERPADEPRHPRHTPHRGSCREVALILLVYVLLVFGVDALAGVMRRLAA
jgi:hypothetical protein